MSSSPPDSTAQSKLNDTLRQVISHVRTTTADSATLAEAEVALAKVEALLAPHAHPGPYQQSGLDVTAGEQPEWGDDPGSFFPYSPVIGQLNPLAAPVVFRVEGAEVVGEGTLGAAYNGPPTAVHGGVVAMVLDELLGCVAVVNERGGFTGTLTIRYLAPTPVGAPLTMKAAVTRSEGRKTWAEGWIWSGETKTAEAEGVFIQSAQLPA
jgi:acyl-coenzyme A thioesterase PaaI-like protein